MTRRISQAEAATNKGTSKLLQFFGSSDSIEALKRSVRDLEKIKVFSSSDLVMLDLRRILRGRIAELEREQFSSAESS